MATTKPKAARQSAGPAVPVDWLLEGPAWVEYRTRVDLLGAGENDRAVKAARARMLADEPVRALVAELADWPAPRCDSRPAATFTALATAAANPFPKQAAQSNG